MDPASASAFYGESYYRGGDYADYASSEQFLRTNFTRFVNRIRRLHTGRRLLEVGCAYGFFLDVATRFWEVSGIDISQGAIASSASRFGRRVVPGDLLSCEPPNSPYDWVVAWDTIEHVDRPALYAERCYELLRPGGHLAFTTGDVGSIVATVRGRRWRLLTPPSHLTFFTRSGVREMLRQAGFEDIRVGTTGYQRSLDFMFFRLFGDRYQHCVGKTSRVRAWLQAFGLYVNLFDVMFVTARKPEGAPLA